MDALVIGGSVSVAADELRDGGKLDLRLVCREPDSIRTGERFRGHVQGFLNDGSSDPDAVFVELVPGTNGVLWRSELHRTGRRVPRQIGETVEVVVRDVKLKNGRTQFELALA